MILSVLDHSVLISKIWGKFLLRFDRAWLDWLSPGQRLNLMAWEKVSTRLFIQKRIICA